MRTIQTKTPAGKMAVKIIFYSGLFFGVVPALLFLAGASPLASILEDLKKEHVKLSESFKDYESCKKASNDMACWGRTIKEKANPNDVDFIIFQAMVMRDVCENGRRVKDIPSYASEIISLEVKTRESGQRSGYDNISKAQSCGGKLGNLCAFVSPIEWGIVTYLGDVVVKQHLALVKKFEENDDLLNYQKCPSMNAGVSINEKKEGV